MTEKHNNMNNVFCFLYREARKKLSQQQNNLILSALKYSADLIFAIHYLPSGVLWSGKLKKWQVGALGSISSFIGLYQVLS